MLMIQYFYAALCYLVFLEGRLNVGNYKLLGLARVQEAAIPGATVCSIADALGLTIVKHETQWFLTTIFVLWISF